MNREYAATTLRKARRLVTTLSYGECQRLLHHRADDLRRMIEARMPLLVVEQQEMLTEAARLASEALGCEAAAKRQIERMMRHGL